MSDDKLSPSHSSGHVPSDYHQPSNATTGPTALVESNPLVLPFSTSSQPIPTTQPSSSIHQFQDYSSAQLSTQLSSVQFAQSRPQSIHGSQPSDGIHQLGQSIYQNYSIYQQPAHPLPLAPGGALTPQATTYHGQGMFSGSHHFSLEGGTFIDNSTTADNFMEKLLQHTIIGADFDSSDRDPPPRCHPGTRLAILQRCLEFIIQCHNEGKLRWLVGPAGVGKSAVMQIVAEKVPDGVIFASVFLSVNGRQDGAKTIVTVAYQFAVKCESYHHFIWHEITKDPSLVRKTLSVQFQKFIVEPFVHRRLFDPSHQFLILIDGLDECDNPRIQQELLGLISNFCISYPTSPVAWIIASRPEPHITSFFADVNIAPAYTKEEMVIDSEEAYEDVQRYLRNELKNIQLAYPTLQRKRQWPSEHEFTQIATAAAGLFAYASTVIRYIGDPHYGDPASQLEEVLAAIAAGPKDGGALGTTGPLVQLDALYERILSKIPDKIMVNTRKILLLCLGSDWSGEPFRVQCNFLGLTEDAAFSAIRHLHAVVKLFESEKADDEPLEFLHKSFEDYICDFKRSGFSDYVQAEARELATRVSLRIIEEVPNVDGTAGDGFTCGATGYLREGPDNCNTISLSWPGDERFAMDDKELRFKLYTDAMETISSKFGYVSSFRTISCFQALTTRFAAPGYFFPFDKLRRCAFGKLRSELAELGKFKQVPLRALDYAAICGEMYFQFKSSVSEPGVEIPDPWNSSCRHRKKLDVNDPQRRLWSTYIYRYRVKTLDPGPADIPRFNIAAVNKSHLRCLSHYTSNCVRCDYCLQRLARLFVNNPDQVATVFTDSTEMCYVEVVFVDPGDGVSEWKYQFLHSGLPTCIDAE